MENFSPICLLFRNLDDNQYENAICCTLFRAISLKYGINYVSLHRIREKRITK